MEIQLMKSTSANKDVFYHVRVDASYVFCSMDLELATAKYDEIKLNVLEGYPKDEIIKIETL